MKEIHFGVKNPDTGKIILVATTLCGGIIWISEIAQIFPNETPIVIMKGESNVKNFGDLRELENSLKMFLPVNETEQCDLWNKSNCCTAPFWLESDICSACKEHASSCCQDCEDYEICLNFDKVIV